MGDTCLQVEALPSLSERCFTRSRARGAGGSPNPGSVCEMTRPLFRVSPFIVPKKNKNREISDFILKAVQPDTASCLLVLSSPDQRERGEGRGGHGGGETDREEERRSAGLWLLPAGCERD